MQAVPPPGGALRTATTERVECRPTHRDRWRSSSDPITTTASDLADVDAISQRPHDAYPPQGGPHRRLPSQDIHDGLPARSAHRRDDHASPEACRLSRRRAVGRGGPPPNGLNDVRYADIGSRWRRNAPSEGDTRHRNGGHSIRRPCKRLEARRSADACPSASEEAVTRCRTSECVDTSCFRLPEMKSPAAVGPRGSGRDVFRTVSSEPSSLQVHRWRRCHRSHPGRRRSTANGP